jgi:predicted DNA-binding transcriptional regulator AlpA
MFSKNESRSVVGAASSVGTKQRLGITRQAVAAIDLPTLAAALAPEVAALMAEQVAHKLKGVLALGEDAILGQEAVAAALNKSEATLELWRAKGIGPRAIKLGPRAVGYRVGEVRRYIHERAEGRI